MLHTDDYKTLTGLAIEGSTDGQILAHMRKKLGAETDAAIATALLAHYLLDVRNYKVNEAAQELDEQPGTISKYAARGHVLHLAATPTTARTVWAQVSSMSLPDARAMAQTLIATPDTQRADKMTNQVTRAAVAKRLGEEATPEKVEAIAEKITDSGTVHPRKIAQAIPAVAEALEISLPEPTRPGATDSANDGKAAKVPTPAEALSMLEKFEQDREQGSDDETPFQVTDEEAGTLVAVATVAARILRQAQRVGEVVEVAALAAETAEMVTEKV